jgi:hypothetical protein
MKKAITVIEASVVLCIIGVLTFVLGIPQVLSSVGVVKFGSNSRVTVLTDSDITNSTVIKGTFSATSPLSYNNTTGAFSIPKGTSTVDGYLNATDRSKFITKADYSFNANNFNGTGNFSTNGIISYGTLNPAIDLTSRVPYSNTTTQNVTAIGNLSVVGTGNFSGNVTVPAHAYGVTWDNNNTVPTKNDVYDEVKIIVSGAQTPIAQDIDYATFNLTNATTLATLTGNSTEWDLGYAHSLLTNNPHSVTKAQVGLNNVTDLDTSIAANVTAGALANGMTATTQSAGTNNTTLATTAYANALVADAITDGVTGIAPSENAVFDALALKAPLADPSFTSSATVTSSTNSTILYMNKTGTGGGSLIYLNNYGIGDTINVNSGATLSAAGVWIDAISTFSQKLNIQEVSLYGYLNKLKSLKLFSYQKKIESDKHFAVKRTYVGYILDDASTPDELIARKPDGTIAGVAPSDGVNFLLAVTKELLNKIEGLETRIEQLEKK